jgi:transcriptional regulator with XRE-family HTH domain
MHVHALQDTSPMNSNICLQAKLANSQRTSTQALALEDDSREERVSRLYASPGGPLIGWLFDECRRRRQEYREMAACLGVTYGYVNQLRSGLRQARHISDDFAVSCAHYLGVPPVVVKMVAGRIPMSDFVTPREPEEDALDRAMAQMLDDPVARRNLPADMSELTLSAKRALVAMYVEASGRDVFGMHQLPEMVRWLQRAATIHDESEAEALRGHRDLAD